MTSNVSNVHVRSNTGHNWKGDINGDGRTDIVARVTPGNGDGTIYVNYGTDNGFNTVFYAGMNIKAFLNNNYVTDVNGDGKADILAIRSRTDNLNSFAAVNYSTGSGFYNITYNNMFFSAEKLRNQIGDFNGDGRTDIFSPHWNSTGSTLMGVYVNYSIGEAFQTIQHGLSGIVLRSDPSWNYIGDFDGDGKSDILVPTWSGSTLTALHVNYSTGQGFETIQHDVTNVDLNANSN